jgi:hypothetical protein
MKTLKTMRTLAASLGALAIGAMANPAMAFDNLEWNWQKDVYEKVIIDAKIYVDVKPTGMVEVEKLQIFLGDVTATNYVAHIYNKPFYEEAGYHDDYYVPESKTRGPQLKTICVYGKDCGGGYGDRDKGWDKVPVKPLDARVELPIILASATAVGNNQSITSDVPVFLHDGQFVAEVKDRYRDHYSSDSLARSMPSGGGGGHCYRDCGPQGNLHTDIAGLFLLGAVAGIFEEAEITAKSTVTDVKNVSVDNSSTAVANNLSVNLASDNPANHVVIADITQFAIANVRAETSTTYVSATGYDHMRQLTTATLSPTDSDPTRVIQVPTPWVSSTATAVGNNASINVGPVLAE